MDKITLCGDNCIYCPRYLAKTEEELSKAAELWYRVGWRNHIVSGEEIQCGGCSSHKQCTYGLVACIKRHGVDKCNQCREFPCEKIEEMIGRSVGYEEKCRQVCSKEEYQLLDKAFFHKEENLKR